MNRKESFKKLIASKKVLIVEDSAEDGILMRGLLERHHFTVRIARNAEETIEVLNNYRFDLCIIDLSLPVMTGAELAKYCHIMFPKMPCVLISGRSDLNEIVKDLDVLMAIEKPLKDSHVELLLSRL